MQSEYIARFDGGEQMVTSIEELDRCLTAAVRDESAAFSLSPSSPAKQLGSLAGRIFGLTPRPAVVLHLGSAGALATFHDRNGVDYRAVNRDFDGEASRGQFDLRNGRQLQCRADEVFPIEGAIELAQAYFRAGDRPRKISWRPAQS